MRDAILSAGSTLEALNRTQTMGWTPLPTASRCVRLAVLLTLSEEGASMEQVNMIGIDLAKNSFQVHGARADGSVAFRKKLSRAKLLDFVAAQPRCTVAMEACGGAHHWGREIGRLGHAVRLVPPIYVKAYVKRQKNDASDAEAICEACCFAHYWTADFPDYFGR